MNDIIIFYLIKRIFVFFDEWLFYCMLLFLMFNKCYKALIGTMIFGGACIYTSYYNIDLIEQQIVNVDQSIFILFN